MPTESFLGGAGARPEASRQALEAMRTARPERAIAVSLLNMLGPEPGVSPIPETFGDYTHQLSLGIYSPLQVLLTQIAPVVDEGTDLDYPFCFSSIAALCQAVSDQLRPRNEDGHPIATGEAAVQRGQEARGAPLMVPDYYAHFRHLLQSVFQRREAREERVAPSLEVYFPFERRPDREGTPPEVDAVTLGQVFGRGVATVQGGLLYERPARSGQLEGMFHSHESTPAGNLYTLGAPAQKVPPDLLSVSLRRDGHVVIATRQNPLFEFYDGGWHIVDLESAKTALDVLLRAVFPTSAIPKEFHKKLVNLAYHMATHWHSGIIAIVRDSTASKEGKKALFEKESDKSEQISKAIRYELRLDSGAPIGLENALHADVGLGRIMLTTAVQDGALVLTPEGDLHSSGRMVQHIGKADDAGAGGRAANAIGNAGIAIKVSQDGGIKVWAKTKSWLTPSEGLRIH